MKTGELEKQLFEEVEKYLDITNGNLFYGNSKEYELNILENRSGFSSTSILENEEHKSKILELIKTEIKHLFLETYSNSKIENYYWKYCSFRTYKNTFENRKNLFLDKYEDNNLSEIDFKEAEIASLDSIKRHKILELVNEKDKMIVLSEIEKKINFLKDITTTNSKDETNQYYAIFTSKEAIDFFGRYFETYIKGTKNKLIELSYIYEKMHSEGLIYEYIKPRMFINFISNPPFSIFLNSDLKSIDLKKHKGRNEYYSVIHELTFRQ